MEDEMVAYWVARSKVNDPEQYKKYADLAPAIIGKFGGKFLARGGKFKIVEGPEKFHRFVVIEFRSFEKAVAKIPNVLQAQRLFGDPDYLLRVVCEDLAAYQRLYDEKLATLPGVQRLSSTLVMKEVVPERFLAG